MDTARLGPLTPAAQRAQLDFVRLTAEAPSSLYFERFLSDGLAAWPESYRRRFPALQVWPGVAGFKQAIRQLVHADGDANVQLASRSIQLVKYAASRLFDHGQHLLTTDLSWPAYQRELVQQAKRAGGRIAILKLRNRILYQGWTDEGVARYVARKFVDQRCDTLFLPAVDHLGIRVPVAKIVSLIAAAAHLRYCLIDAAQAIGNIPLTETTASADFVVAGAHKWLGGYLPLGIGWTGSRRPDLSAASRLAHDQNEHHCRDPLSRFIETLTLGHRCRSTETVNLLPLFTAAGALADQLPLASCPVASTRAMLETLTLPAGYGRVVSPHASLQSQIVLYEPTRSALRSQSTEATRQRWSDAGFIVSAYTGGLTRLSAPYRFQPTALSNNSLVLSETIRGHLP